MKLFKEYITPPKKISINEALLNEVFIKGKRHKDGDNILAFKQFIWVWDRHTFDDVVDSINKVLRTDFEEDHEISDWIERNFDAVFGQIDGKYLRFNSVGDYKPSTNSPLLQKTISALKLRGIYNTDVDYDTYDEIDYEVEINKFKQSLSSQKFYHGTSYNNARKMKGLGLVASPLKSNFKDIKHKDKVFITTDISKASFHAETAAKSSDSSPVIIELKLPDMSRLITDYDVAISVLGSDNPLLKKLGYDKLGTSKSKGMEELKKRYGKDIDKLSSHLGFFGYKGRIPFNHFTNILVDEAALKNAISSDMFDREPYYTNDDGEKYQNVKPSELESYYHATVDEIEEEIEDENDFDDDDEY